ncbi:hypothetical protein ACFL1X_10350 [Candidatus Hydrogenedentota bacterium]
MKTIRHLLSMALLTILFTAWTMPAKGETEPDFPANHARTARISANVERGKGFLAKFVADGVIRKPGTNDDGHSWASAKRKNKHNGVLTFEWDTAIEIGEIIYYGRTFWSPRTPPPDEFWMDFRDCWREYEVYADEETEPVIEGHLKKLYGPQRITLPSSVSAKKIVLKFTKSYNGPYPGAAEVQVFSVSPSDAELEKINSIHGDKYYHSDRKLESLPESVQLREKLVEDKLGFDSVVAVKRHAVDPTHVYTYHVEGFRPGGGLYVTSFHDDNGTVGVKSRELVSTPDGQILDCNLSFDGKEVLFSWKKKHDVKYVIYRINVDGTGLTALTSGDYNDFNPCWLPDGGIAFLSDRKPAFAYCMTSTVGVLYRMDRDGGNVLRLSANYLNDFTPSVMNDGTIMFSRWEYVDKPAIPIQSLWTIHPDGTNLSGYYGNRVLSPATFMEGRVIPDSTKVLCVMTAHNGPCRGAIGIIDPSQGVNAQEAIRNLTPEIDIGKVDQGNGNQIQGSRGGAYESPYPVDSDLFLVSRGGKTLLRDYDGKKQVTLLSPDGILGYYSAQAIRAIPNPPVIPSFLQESAGDWATVYVQDVYNGLEPEVKRGEIKQICVVQEIEKPKREPGQLKVFGYQFPVVSCGATYAPKKVWGYVSVNDDGSASFKAPAKVPIYFMVIDAEGRAIQRMRSFTHLMPGEVQGCIGCHESRNESPPGRKLTAAIDREPLELDPPEWGLDGFSYARVVQLVLDKNCVQCHNAFDQPNGVDLSGDKTDFFNVSYEILARKGTISENFRTKSIPYGKEGKSPYTSWIPTYNGQEANILLIEPRTWGSPASKLTDIILADHPDKNGEKRVDLNENEKRRILAWIDLNVPYYGNSLSNYSEFMGCRQMYPKKLDKVLQDTAQRRCISCHDQEETKRGKPGKVNLPRSFYTRIENPHLNSFMLAPLAKSAGGTEACGKVVFESTDDPDYKAILATFEPLHEMLAEIPRIDMGDEARFVGQCNKKHEGELR